MFAGEREIPREIKRTNIDVVEVLGKGNFGEVSRGIIVELDGQHNITVAVKVLHKSSEAADARIQLLEEAAITAQFKHPNVLSTFD